MPDRRTFWSAIATILIFLWELSLGLSLVIKGFTPPPHRQHRGRPDQIAAS